LKESGTDEDPPWCAVLCEVVFALASEAGDRDSQISGKDCFRIAYDKVIERLVAHENEVRLIAEKHAEENN
jgi:hypothetical protein